MPLAWKFFVRTRSTISVTLVKVEATVEQTVIQKDWPVKGLSMADSIAASKAYRK